MTFWRPTLKTLPLLTSSACIAAALALFPSSLSVRAQSFEPAKISPSGGSPLVTNAGLADARPAADGSASLLAAYSSSSEPGLGVSADAEPPLPSAPEPALGGGNPQREGVPWAADWHAVPFSRIGIGADVSPLGIGIKGVVLLDEYLDGRVDMNFFGYSPGRIEIDGINIYGNLHFASGAAKVDIYPWNSMWRLTGGLMLFDSNRASATTDVAPGTSFKMDGVTYFSSSADPTSGTGLIQLATAKPAPLFSFGFGRFIPRSNRHWSFPTEFGVIYTGTPSLTVTTAGSVCTDPALTVCSSITDTSNPVGQAFNSNLQTQLAKWRKDLEKVQFYPIFSYSVVYSFNIR